MKNTKYAYSAYDRHLSLKPPLLIWVAILFLMRPYVVFGLYFTELQSRSEFIKNLYIDQTSLAIGAIIGVLGLAVLFVTLRRHPTAGKVVRTLWANGRAILISAITLNLALVLFPAISNIDYLTENTTWIQAGVCGYLIWELLTSQHIRDAFNDFPAPDKGS